MSSWVAIAEPWAEVYDGVWKRHIRGTDHDFAADVRRDSGAVEWEWRAFDKDYPVNRIALNASRTACEAMRLADIALRRAGWLLADPATEADLRALVEAVEAL